MSTVVIDPTKEDGVPFSYDDNVAIGIPSGGVFTNQAQIRRVDNKYYYEFKPEASRPIMGLNINWCNANIGEDRKINTTEELFNWLIAVEELAKESADLSNYYNKDEVDDIISPIDSAILDLDSSKVDANKDNEFTIEQKTQARTNIGAASISALNEKVDKAALGGLTLVKLTQTEYDALTTKDPNTLYVIVG